MRVLFIENDARFAEPIIRRLEFEGHEVVFAVETEQAREAILAGGFDVVLIDLWMPRGPYSVEESNSGRKTGVLLLGEIETMWPDVPVVVLTGRAEIEIREEVEAHPSVRDYLQKPTALGHILHALENAVAANEPPA